MIFVATLRFQAELAKYAAFLCKHCGYTQQPRSEINCTSQLISHRMVALNVCLTRGSVYYWLGIPSANKHRSIN